MINVNAVSKHFGRLGILNGIDLHVAREESYVILGQSGSGKSVLLKILAGLLAPSSGTVTINSTNLGMLFQKNALFDSMTVEENLNFTLRERRPLLSADERQSKVNQYLEFVGLKGTNLLSPNELSGGMQKRLGIARALIIDPEVVFYDEPTAGLDPITSRMIAELILNLKKQIKATIVIVTSDVMRAFQLGDQIGLLIPTAHGARLEKIGTPEEARNSKNAAVQQFLKGLTKGPLSETRVDPDVY